MCTARDLNISTSTADSYEIDKSRDGDNFYSRMVIDDEHNRPTAYGFRRTNQNNCEGYFNSSKLVRNASPFKHDDCNRTKLPNWQKPAPYVAPKWLA